MRPIKLIAVGALGSFCLFGTATAAELAGAEIKDLVAGKSVYLEYTTASATGSAGIGIIYYALDGIAQYKTPKGVMWHGTWKINGNTNCHDWKRSPQQSLR